MKVFSIITSILIISISGIKFQADKVTVKNGIQTLHGNVKVEVNGYELKADKAILYKERKEIIAVSKGEQFVRLIGEDGRVIESDSILFNYEKNTFLTKSIRINR